MNSRNNVKRVLIVEINTKIILAVLTIFCTVSELSGSLHPLSSAGHIQSLRSVPEHACLCARAKPVGGAMYQDGL